VRVNINREGPDDN